MFVPLFLVFALATAAFYDTTCQKLKCTRSEMKAVNQAKMLALGMHDCTSTYIKFFPNGTQQFASSFSSTVNSYYDATTGSLRSEYNDVTGANVIIDEYCDGKGSVCIEIVNSTNSGFYTESIDQNKDGLGSVYRSIGYYTTDAKKRIKGVQWLIPTDFGDVLLLTFLDENNKLDYSMYQTCYRV